MNLTAILCFIVGGVLVVIAGSNLTFPREQEENHQIGQVILGMLGLAALAIGLVLSINR